MLRNCCTISPPRTCFAGSSDREIEKILFADVLQIKIKFISKLHQPNYSYSFMDQASRPCSLNRCMRCMLMMILAAMGLRCSSNRRSSRRFKSSTSKSSVFSSRKINGPNCTDRLRILAGSSKTMPNVPTADIPSIMAHRSVGMW